MSSIPFAEAQPKLQELIARVSSSSEPITIVSDNNNAVLISEETWKGIQETVYLLSIPKMGDSIREGLSTPIRECSEDLDW